MKRKRWNRVYFLAPVILFITGAAIFLYPAISNYIAEKSNGMLYRPMMRK